MATPASGSPHRSRRRSARLPTALLLPGSAPTHRVLNAPQIRPHLAPSGLSIQMRLALNAAAIRAHRVPSVRSIPTHRVASVAPTQAPRVASARLVANANAAEAARIFPPS